jgi:hypothetical protein
VILKLENWSPVVILLDTLMRILFSRTIILWPAQKLMEELLRLCHLHNTPSAIQFASSKTSMERRLRL